MEEKMVSEVRFEERKRVILIQRTQFIHVKLELHHYNETQTHKLKIK